VQAVSAEAEFLCGMPRKFQLYRNLTAIIRKNSGKTGTVRQSEPASDMIILMKRNQKPEDYAAMIGERLKNLRVKGNLKQSAMAAYIGKKSSSVSSYELGECLPPVEVLHAYADHFHVDMNYLMGFTKTGTLHSVYCSDAELELLEYYRSQTEDGKKLVNEIVHTGLEIHRRHAPAPRREASEHRGLVNEHQKPYDPDR
jgi:transcriptional regulator with XRE-family HTH domain